MKIDKFDATQLEKYGDAIAAVIKFSPKFSEDAKQVVAELLEGKVQDIAHTYVQDAIKDLGIEFDEDAESEEIRSEFEMNIFFQLIRAFHEKIIHEIKEY